MFLNDHNTLTLSPPPSNSESYLSCYYGNCTESWAITLDQSVQGNSYGYYKIGTGTGLDISITWTHNGETKTLAEWKNTESQGGMGPGIPLAAVPGDIITLNITCRNSGTYYWWSNGKYSYITIME